MTDTIAIRPELEGIDADVARFVVAILDGSAGEPGSGVDDLPRRRAAAEANREVWRQGGPAMQRREDLVARSGPIEVGVRLLDAGGEDELRPALIYVHGGGFTVFSLDTHDRLMREYAARSGAIVIGVDYSLSPEAKFPVALHEVAAVVDWIGEEGRSLGIDPERVAIGGDSAGANLSLATCLLLRERSAGTRITAMLLNYGFFDADFATESQRRHGGAGKMLTTEELAGYLENYLGGTPHRHNPFALPALAQLHDLPPSLHIIAECDPLADGDRAMAAQLEQAGNQVEALVYRGATHSFLEAVSISTLAERAIAESADWLRVALASHHAAA